ncbi:MAG TPA: cytochrome c peroxidase [Chitinophagaceae bacterium]|nr:cytochrome c peroxidase [Chitinophagaceae bacterium]
MRKCFVLTSLLFAVVLSVSFSKESLRNIYSRPSSQWPAPFIDDRINWQELGILPGSPIEDQKASLQHIIELGKMLFFDARLSGSGKISCATCHQPELSWTDGKERSTGHEGTLTKRNSPSIQNTWFYKKLFWDGRAKNLEDQAFAPINSETEMHSEMPELMRKLRAVKGYKDLFAKAFGDDEISPDRMTEAIASFEKTIVSAKSRFDKFLEGDKKILTNSELRGLHLFRTKARCMNCHNGPLFSDNQFHNNGFHYYENGFIDSAKFDKGLYNTTHDIADLGKFKTPSLRDVMNTGPWMHHGKMRSIKELIGHYNKGAEGNGGSEKTIKMLFLTNKEIADLESFLKAISSAPVPFKKPVLPD